MSLTGWQLIRARIRDISGITVAERNERTVTETVDALAAEAGYADRWALLAEIDTAKLDDVRAQLIRHVAVGATWFMREQRGLSELIAAMGSRRDVTGRSELRIWCVGCSTGQEPYTLAMMLAESGFRTSILATDINVTSLRVASEGKYRRAELQRVPAQWRRRWFRDAANGQLQLVDSLRQSVSFVGHNIIADPCPPTGWRHFDAVVCRNLLIYFSPADALLTHRRLRRACRPHGYVLIGAVEQPLVTLSGCEDLKRTGLVGAGRTAVGTEKLGVPAIPAHSSVAKSSPAESRPLDVAAIERLMAAEDWDGALEQSRRAVAETPLLALNHLVLGTVVKGKGDTEAAITHFRVASFLDDQAWLAPYQLGLCLEQLGKAQEAAHHYRHAIAIIARGGPSGLPDRDTVDLSKSVLEACNARLRKLDEGQSPAKDAR